MLPQDGLVRGRGRGRGRGRVRVRVRTMVRVGVVVRVRVRRTALKVGVVSRAEKSSAISCRSSCT